MVYLGRRNRRAQTKEKEMREALAEWLGIKIEELDDYYIIHKCKKLKVKDLMELMMLCVLDSNVL